MRRAARFHKSELPWRLELVPLALRSGDGVYKTNRPGHLMHIFMSADFDDPFHFIAVIIVLTGFDS